jgi:hypothetical protein
VTIRKAKSKVLAANETRSEWDDNASLRLSYVGLTKTVTSTSGAVKGFLGSETGIISELTATNALKAIQEVVMARSGILLSPRNFL